MTPKHNNRWYRFLSLVFLAGTILGGVVFSIY